MALSIEHDDNYRLRDRPKHHFGIRSPNIILGADMRTFLPFLPDESLSVVLGVRSSVYIVPDRDNNGDIVSFGIQVAHKLRPGGGWLDDWPRGNYDAIHYTEQAVHLLQQLRRFSSLRSRVKLFLIWGPSEEFPYVHPFVPVAAVLLKANHDGRFPVRELSSRLIRSLYNKEKKVSIPVQYHLVEVTEDTHEQYKRHRDKKPENHPILALQRAFEKELNEAILALRER